MSVKLATASTPGICANFRVGDAARVEQAVAALHRIHVSHLRTEISWADWSRKGGADWFDWLLPRLAKEFELLPCVVDTPAKYSADGQPNSPPDDPRLFGEFIDGMLTAYGDCFDAIELWAPDGADTPRWNRAHDPDLSCFAQMIATAALVVKRSRKRVVLSTNIQQHDHLWWRVMQERGVFAYIDVVGAQTISHAASFDCAGAIKSVCKMLAQHGSHAAVWLTAAGYRGGMYDDAKQLACFEALRAAPVERAYWHELFDAAAAGGLLRSDGSPKLLFRTWERDGLDHLTPLAKLNNLIPRTTARPILITGGCGRIGIHLADRLLALGHTVLLFDNLSQSGSEAHLCWLRARHQDRLLVHLADIRDSLAINASVKRASDVVHLTAHAGAVGDELDVNVRGTLNLLEAIRALPAPIPLLHLCSDMPRLNSTFAWARTLADQYVEHAGRNGLDATVLRVGIQTESRDRLWAIHRDPTSTDRAASIEHLVSAILDARERHQNKSPEPAEQPDRAHPRRRIERLNRTHRAS